MLRGSVLLLLLCRRTPAEETVPPYDLETLEQSALSAVSPGGAPSRPVRWNGGDPRSDGSDAGPRAAAGAALRECRSQRCFRLFKCASTISLDRREGSGCGCYNLAFSLTGLQKSLRSSGRSFMIQGHGTYGLAYTPQFSMQSPLLGLLILVA